MPTEPEDFFLHCSFCSLFKFDFYGFLTLQNPRVFSFVAFL